MQSWMRFSDPENFVSLITCVKTSSQKTDLLSGVSDFLLWYAKDKTQVKYNALYKEKELGADGTTQYKHQLDINTGEEFTNCVTKDGSQFKVFRFLTILRRRARVTTGSFRYISMDGQSQ